MVLSSSKGIFLAVLLEVVLTSACLAAHPKTANTSKAGVTPLERARSFIERRDFLTAESVLRDLLKTQPNNAKAHTLLSWTLYSTGKFEEALSEVTTAIKLSPNDPQAHEYRAMALLNLNRPFEATKEFKAVAKMKDCHCQNSQAKKLYDAIMEENQEQQGSK